VVVYWNYLMGRHVLTGDNQDDALEFLYNHNATHLLIDSSDIGKYTAISNIGSDKDFDRYAWILPLFLDENQIKRTNNQTTIIYPGGLAIDEDLTIDRDGKEIFIPAEVGIVGAIVLPIKNIKESKIYQQPYIIIVYKDQQYNVNLRYLYIQEKLIDFGTGIEAAAFIFPKLISKDGSINKNEIGTALYLSPRIMRGMIAQVYLMDDPFNKFPNFKLAHKEPDSLINDLENQGIKLPDFVYFNKLHGPIKIWDIEYTGKEEIKEKYIDTDESKYVDWAL